MRVALYLHFPYLCFPPMRIRTYVFRTCVFHPCEMHCFVLAFSELAISSTCVFSAPLSLSTVALHAEVCPPKVPSSSVGSSFFVGLTVFTDRHTDRSHYTCNNRPHLCNAYMQCSLIKVTLINIKQQLQLQDKGQQSSYKEWEEQWEEQLFSALPPHHECTPQMADVSDP